MSLSLRAHPSVRWWALGVLALTQLVVVLDTTIVTIALPQAQLELHLDDSQRQWVVTAYALAFGALLLLGGRIADYWGRKRTFMVGMIGFGLASVWGGLCSSGGELIIARGVQGAFAALLAPAALAMLTVLFSHGRERGIAFAIFGTVAGCGAAIGLLLGGVLTEFSSWRACLLVNVVFVLIGVIGGLLVLSESKAPGTNRFDVVGTLLVVLGLGCLVYGFTLAENGWGELATVSFLALGAVLLVIFGWVETKVASPLLPMRVILHRVRGGALLIQTIIGAIMIGSMFYLTMHFQLVMHMSPLIAGLANVVLTAVIMVCTPISARVLGRWGPRPMLILGPLLAAAGLFYLTGITPEGTYAAQILPALILLGMGLSLIFVPLQNLALTGVRPEDSGVASAAVNSVFHIGGSIGLAVFTALYASSAQQGITRGHAELRALTEGYSTAFLASAIAMVVAAIIAVIFIRGTKEELMPAHEEQSAVPAAH